MSHPPEDPDGTIARVIADAHAFAQDGRPCFGLTVLYQALALAKGETGVGSTWASGAVAKVEAEIRSYRVKYRLTEV